MYFMSVACEASRLRTPVRPPQSSNMRDMLVAFEVLRFLKSIEDNLVQRANI